MVSEVLIQVPLKAIIWFQFLQQGWSNGLCPVQVSAFAEVFPSMAGALPDCLHAEHHRSATNPLPFH